MRLISALPPRPLCEKMWSSHLKTSCSGQRDPSQCDDFLVMIRMEIFTVDWQLIIDNGCHVCVLYESNCCSFIVSVLGLTRDSKLETAFVLQGLNHYTD